VASPSSRSPCRVPGERRNRGRETSGKVTMSKEAAAVTGNLVRVPRDGVLLGLDYGTKRIGVAISNAEQTMALPLESYTVRSPKLDLAHLRELSTDYRVKGLVLGLPVLKSGDESRQAAAVREYGTWLATELQLPAAYWDERHSSTEAELLLWSRGESPRKRKDRLDPLAAQIILQGYLDAADRDRVPGALE
jgi:putative holliday junction resolvase